jgi:hypothetical protein
MFHSNTKFASRFAIPNPMVPMACCNKVREKLLQRCKVTKAEA